MANIATYIAQIETAARGEAVRDSIVNALKAINDEGVGNAETLESHPASYFATRTQLNALQANLTPSASTVEIYPQDWDDNHTYSFETDYPSSGYDIYIQPGPQTTEDQLRAIASAGIVAGSTNLNTIRCVGTVPSIPIQVLVMAVTKS
jgi:hypothetical protein